MNTNDIILTIDAEISRLQQAKALLTDTFNLTPAKRKPGRPATASGSGKATSFNPADFDAKARKRRGMSFSGERNRRSLEQWMQPLRPFHTSYFAKLNEVIARICVLTPIQRYRIEALGDPSTFA